MPLYTLEHRIHVAIESALDGLDTEIAELGLDMAIASDFHTWMKLGREMNKRQMLIDGNYYYSGSDGGLWPSILDLPTSGIMQQFSAGVSVGNLPASFTEWSGIATAKQSGNEGYIWGIVDGSATEVTAIDKSDASTAGTWDFTGTFSDLEDCDSVAIDGINYLYLADTGDNANARSTIRIARVVEPTVTGSDGSIDSGDVEIITCEYPSGDIPSHKDCETIIIDSETGDVYFITKRISPVKIYRLSYAESYSGTQTLEYVGEPTTDSDFNTISTTPSGNNGYVVGGTMRADGKEILLKSYSKIWSFARDPESETILETLQGTPVEVYGYVGGGADFYHPVGEPQGESICYASSDGSSIFTCSEFVSGNGSASDAYPLYKYDRIDFTVEEFTFRQGENGYTGCVDTYIDSDNASTNQSAATALVCDYNYSAFPTISRTRRGLLKFDLSSIDSTSQVSQAYIEFEITNEGYGIQLHRMLTGWDEDSTHDSLSGGISLDDVEAVSAADVVVGSGSSMNGYTGYARVNVSIDTVQGWIDGTYDNHGWAITGKEDDSTGDGMQVASSKNTTDSFKPRLVVYAENFQPVISLVGSTTRVGTGVIELTLAAGASSIDDSSVSTSDFVFKKNSAIQTDGVFYDYAYNSSTNTVSFTRIGEGNFEDDDYDIEIAADSILSAGASGNSVTTISLTIDSTVSVSWQEGDSNSYSSTHDTFIDTDNPTQNNSTAASIVLDFNSPSRYRTVLMRFEDLVGSGAGQISSGATVESVKLQLYINTEGQRVAAHRMLETWEETSTHTSLGGDIDYDDVQAATTADIDTTVRDDGSTSLDTYTGFRTLSSEDSDSATGLIDTVQAWVDGEANYGWVLTSQNEGDGMQVDSKNGATQDRRPKLIVTYSE